MEHLIYMAQTLDLVVCLGLIHPSIKGVELNDVTEGTVRDVKYEKYDYIAQVKTTSIEAFKEVCFLEVSDTKHYYELWYKLCKVILKGHATLTNMAAKDFDMIKK